MATRGYNSYRGRVSTGRIVLIVVLVLILLGAVGYLAVQNYLVYDEAGQVHLELPWGRHDGTPTPDKTPVEDVDIDRLEPESMLTPVTALHATLLPDDCLWWGADYIMNTLVPEDMVLAVKRENGGITYRNEDIDEPERIDAKDKVYEIVRTTAEYMRQMETAPFLKADGLEDGYKVLADFNGVVLAGCPSKYGTQFVTWDRDFDHKGVSHGHYYTGLYASGNYEAAKRDFATRSGLIPEQQVFREEQLIEIYRCCADTLQNDTALSYKREKTMQEVQEQIEQCLPDIAERIQQLDAEPTQEQTM